MRVYYNPSRQQAKAFKSWCPRLSLTPKREEKIEIPKDDQLEEVEDNPNVKVAQETARNLSERASSLTEELQRLQFEQQRFQYRMAGKDINLLNENICEPALDNTYHY